MARARPGEVVPGSPARTRSIKKIQSSSRFIRTGKNSDAAAALLLEAAFGYPDGLYRRAGHPVSWIGALISGLERELNRPGLSEGRRRAFGVLACGAVLACGWGFGLLLQRASRRLRIPEALPAIPGLAQRSLHDHVAAVQAPLLRGDLAQARAAVSRIVGRDVEGLEAAGVSAAALESLAESFNDGVVAPAFWLAVAGLPGLYAYKALNTADSLIGHREPRWRAFGWASARADDFANLIPARLAGGLIALAGGGGWGTMLRDARKHASPNAGWPEAAMAGALKVRLGGPAAYDGVSVERPAFAAGAPPPTPADLSRGLALYRRAGLLLFAGAVAWSLSRRRRP